MFRSPQVVLLCSNLAATSRFYTDLGFREVFRTPEAPAAPIHVDLELDGYRLGLATAASTREHHGLDPVASGQRAAVVLWTDDVVAAHRRLVDGGAPDLAAPHVWLRRLLIAWVADPDGHAVQVVQPLGTLQHVALAADWDAAQSSGSYEVSTRDRSLAEEGFIHLAFPHQLEGVVSRFYADVTDPLVVLEIDPSELGSDVVVEPGDASDSASQRFPHLYGPIPVRAVVGVAQLDGLPQRAAQHEPQASEQDDP